MAETSESDFEARALPNPPLLSRNMDTMLQYASIYLTNKAPSHCTPGIRRLGDAQPAGHRSEFRALLVRSGNG